MQKVETMGPCFALTTGTPAGRRPEGGYAVARESGFTLVARAGLVRPTDARSRRRASSKLLPILGLAMLTVGWGQLEPSSPAKAALGAVIHRAAGDHSIHRQSPSDRKFPGRAARH